jgi:hypothetical protein
MKKTLLLSVVVASAALAQDAIGVKDAIRLALEKNQSIQAAGAMESPVYAILKLGPEIDEFQIPEGYGIEQHMAALPSDPGRYSMKWEGEWHITYEVFRDLGIAFAAVLILIYGLAVGWFQSFLTPLIIMAAIPFSLVGILPAHGLLHAFTSAVYREIVKVDGIQERLYRKRLRSRSTRGATALASPFSDIPLRK